MDSLLTHVERPARYTDGEIHARSQVHEAEVCIALAFPDVYEIGLSYHGFQLLYERVNNRKGLAADRAYAPWPDMEIQMREKGKRLCALESQKQLSEFDLIGFTLQHEMNYTNLLNMIDLAGLPLESEERRSVFPLVIAGGEGAYNPEPLSSFIDAFLIGDGEEVLIELMHEIREAKKGALPEKRELLQRLSRIEGVYIPSFYRVSYSQDGYMEEVRNTWQNAPDSVEKRVFDITRDRQCVKPLVSLTRIVHDRFNVEIKRGCSCGCRFCISGMTNRPSRERNVSQIVEICEEGIKNTGHDEISLLSLSTASYSRIGILARSVNERFAKQHVSISLPSLRPDQFDLQLAREIQKVKKSGFTFAPEAGTERLRTVINKPLDEEYFLTIVDEVIQAGWFLIKLYFMIGLPTENDEDLDGIVRLVRRVVDKGKRKWGRKFRVNVSLSPFVPKPHTPFQWEDQPPLEELQRRIAYLRDNMKNRYVELKPHDPHVSVLEAAIARGDGRIGNAIKRAWQKGCRFDSWKEFFRFDLWKSAFEEEGLEIAFYTSRKREMDEALPWGRIDTLVDSRFLRLEFERAHSGETTPDCADGDCSGCGVCGKFASSRVDDSEETLRKLSHDSLRPQRSLLHPLHRFRLVYEKEGMLRFLSHLDMGKLIKHMIRIAGLHAAYTTGFHPQIKVQYGPPLGLFFTSSYELLDLFLEKDYVPEEVLDTLENIKIAGLRFNDVREVPVRGKSLSIAAEAADYEICFPASWFDTQRIERQELLETFEKFHRLTRFDFRVGNRSRETVRDLKKTIRNLKVRSLSDDLIVEIRCSLVQNEYVAPMKVISALIGRDVGFDQGVRARRTMIVLSQ